MFKISFDKPKQSAFDDFRRYAIQRYERAALVATDKGASSAKVKLRTAMTGARLGRLGNAIGETSDLKKNGAVHRRGASGFSASGIIFVRSKSERTLSTLQAYTEGADIRPVRGRWLWLLSGDFKALVGSGKSRTRLRPGLWQSSGMEARFGPLFTVKSVDGKPLLVVKNATVSASGKSRSAKPRTKTGKVPKNQRAKEFLVVFIAIPNTSRSKRIDVQRIMNEEQALLEQRFNSALGMG